MEVESMLDSSASLSCTSISTDPAAQSTSDRNSQILPENLSVLFVDDDPILRKLFARAVKKAAPPWTISEAASGEAAIQLVESSSKEFDVIWMDQYMSSTEKQMLGTDAVRELRSRGVDSTICGLSANNMEEQFLDAGSDTFLLKPFPSNPIAMEQELLRIVNSRNSCSV